MTTVWIDDESKLEIVIIRNAPEPPHVHVFGSQGQVTIILNESDGSIHLERVDKMPDNRDVDKACQIVQKNQEHLLERWRDLHG